MTTLPDQLYLNDFAGNWESYRDALFAIFNRDFMNPPYAVYQGLPIYFHPKIGYAGLPVRFWHLISDGEKDTPEEDRIPNLRRCEKLSWTRPVIDLAEAAMTPAWTEREGRQTVAYNCSPDFDYVVVLKRNPRDSCWYLASAYCPHPGRKKRLEEKWAAFQGEAK